MHAPDMNVLMTLRWLLLAALLETAGVSLIRAACARREQPQSGSLLLSGALALFVYGCIRKRNSPYQFGFNGSIFSIGKAPPACLQSFTVALGILCLDQGHGSSVA